MVKKIKVSAPGKLMLFGEHAVIYHWPCLVTAIDQRMRVWIKKKPGAKIEIEALDVGVAGYARKVEDLGKKANIPKGVRFLEAATKNFFEKYEVQSGLKIRTKSEFSSAFGFGSSSAVTVGTLRGLGALFKIRLGKKQLFNLAYRTVLDVQGVGSGFDLAAAIWGRTVYFVTGGRTIVPLKIKKLPLVIGYTGIKADTPTLVHQVAQLRRRQPRLVNGIFDNIALLTQKAKSVLLKSDWQAAGELMNLNQGFLAALGVNTPELASLVFAAREAGAYGAKLSGAGGGDCMIALVPERKKALVIRAIKKAGGEYLDVESNAEGVKIL